MEIQIIADSCCDLTPTLRRVLRVRTASLTSGWMTVNLLTMKAWTSRP